MEQRMYTTKKKALVMNLNSSLYGTLAEIGGGQEVAANFFEVGAASGTIAKTMSAYDMTFSDAIYGETRRYVCEEKLLKMLEKEYGLLRTRLAQRAPNTHFFAFANTVETLNYKKTNRAHGWIGIRFQLTPESEPNDCIIHVVLRDNERLWQQEVLGTIGVNLIYGGFHKYKKPEDFLISLRDNISHDRIDIDYFRLDGPSFTHVDNRLMSLKLVKHGMTQSSIFDKTGEVRLPSSFLYKKNICILRGRFQPVTHVSVDMLLAGLRKFKENTDLKELVVVAELTLNDLASGANIDEKDFLNRVDLLNALGQHVLISNFQEHYKIAKYISRFTRGKRVAFILGVDHLTRLFNEQYYEDLSGGIMEALGKLFGPNINILTYPRKDLKKNKLLTSKNFVPPNHLAHLFRHLLHNGYIEDIDTAKTENLHIISDKVIKMIQQGIEGWEEFVPYKVSSLIKEKKMFMYTGLWD